MTTNNDYEKLVEALLSIGFKDEGDESYSKIIEYNNGTFKCTIKLSEISVDKFIVLIEDVDISKIPVDDLMNCKFDIIKSVKSQIHEYCINN